MYLRTGCIQPLPGGYPKGTLPEFIYSRHNFKTQDTQMTVLMVDTEEKLQKPLDKVVNKKEGRKD